MRHAELDLLSVSPYAELLRLRRPAGLDAVAATELRGFAASLRQDASAVRAAMAEPWSNGPPRSTVWNYLDFWEWDGTIARLRRALRREPRKRRARCQSNHGDPRCTERQERRKRGRSLGPSGFDAGKKVLGRKRHVLVDPQGGARQGPWPAKQVRVASGGLLLNVDVHAADIQDRDSAKTLLRQARRRFPFVERIVAHRQLDA